MLMLDAFEVETLHQVIVKMAPRSEAKAGPLAAC